MVESFEIPIWSAPSFDESAISYTTLQEHTINLGHGLILYLVYCVLDRAHVYVSDTKLKLFSVSI